MANSEPERLSVGRLQWSSMVAVRPKPSATAVDVTKPFMVKVLLMFWRAAPSRWVGMDILHLCDSLRGSHK